MRSEVMWLISRVEKLNLRDKLRGIYKSHDFIICKTPPNLWHLTYGKMSIDGVYKGEQWHGFKTALSAFTYVRDELNKTNE